MFVLLLTVDSNDTQHDGIQILNNCNGLASNEYLISVPGIRFFLVLRKQQEKGFHESGGAEANFLGGATVSSEK